MSLQKFEEYAKIRLAIRKLQERSVELSEELVKIDFEKMLVTDGAVHKIIYHKKVFNEEVLNKIKQVKVLAMAEGKFEVKECPVINFRVAKSK